MLQCVSDVSGRTHPVPRRPLLLQRAGSRQNLVRIVCVKALQSSWEVTEGAQLLTLQISRA